MQILQKTLVYIRKVIKLHYIGLKIKNIKQVKLNVANGRGKVSHLTVFDPSLTLPEYSSCVNLIVHRIPLEMLLFLVPPELSYSKSSHY